MHSSPVPYEFRGARGMCYAALPEGLELVLADLMSKGISADVETLKSERVWAWRDVVIKRSDPGNFFERRFRASPSTRAALAALRLAPVHTPLPILTLDVRTRGRLDSSWLVMQRVRGQRMDTALKQDPRARAALPAFLATMHAHHVLHGDLNVYNAIWDGTQWHLIDLDGLRNPLHRLRLKSAAELQWARIAGALRETDSVRPLFLEYARLLRRTDAEAAWTRIAQQAVIEAERYEQMLARRRALAEQTKR